ncbi:MAG: SET domain-containing protein-lysine N-methyltransferase [Gemmatimonadaceae bacterium]
MAKHVVASPQPFVVRRSGIQGKGAFATRPIKKGERVAEYVGERISWKAADARYDDTGMKRHHTFLFSVTSRTVIDAAVGGNDARFINHSCDPNCEATDDGGRIFIEATRAIAEGSELFYDYSYARDKDTGEDDEKLYVCFCGSPKCRGTILEPLKKAKRLPSHHAAARHPHEEGSPSTATKTKSSQKKEANTSTRTRVGNDATKRGRTKQRSTR